MKDNHNEVSAGFNQKILYFSWLVVVLNVNKLKDNASSVVMGVIG